MESAKGKGLVPPNSGNPTGRGQLVAPSPFFLSSSSWNSGFLLDGVTAQIGGIGEGLGFPVPLESTLPCLARTHPQIRSVRSRGLHAWRLPRKRGSTGNQENFSFFWVWNIVCLALISPPLVGGFSWLLRSSHPRTPNSSPFRTRFWQGAQSRERPRKALVALGGDPQMCKFLSLPIRAPRSERSSASMWGRILGSRGQFWKLPAGLLFLPHWRLLHL